MVTKGHLCQTKTVALTAIAVLFKHIKLPATTRQLKGQIVVEIKIEKIDIEKYWIWLLKMLSWEIIQFLILWK